MKKSVLALAVLGTFAGVASAQSSVTMFGVVDLSLRTVSNNDRSYQLAQDGLASSRLGFRGIEDLGGGLKASFWLEAGLGPDTGLASPSYGNGNPADQALIFNRRSTVSLTNQWGELRLGRDYTATFWNWTVFDPFGTNGVGSASNLGLGFAAVNVLRPGAAYGTLVRANNMVGYILPNGVFGPGLYGQVQVAAGESAPGNKYYGGRIGYAAGPFDVAAAYGVTDITVDGDVTLDNWNLGGSWNFGILKASGFYGHLDLKGVPGFSVDQNNWYVGVAAPFGQWNFKASYGGMTRGGNVPVPTLTSTTGDQKATQWAIGADYNLSKRTAVYATWSSISNTSTQFSVSGTGSPLDFGHNSTGAEVGIRHSF